MYLKKISAVGFKSFADRVTINLQKNHITGIVGPNGSGKSNTIDSVRWVMGEQNAKMLRGEKATDIIFAGSQKRKPMAMAEVTLVFDNQEASSFCPPEYRHEPEISLTRRLYLDGEREYLINKKPCRLKDIISFFSATGLGGRSYSMIQQGQVDRILQAKPQQIREILEEASGTLVFKKRRDEAEKKLENTRVSLSRIEDLLKELGNQKKTLEDQVKKARKHQETSEKLKEEELSLFSHNYNLGKQSLEEFEKQTEELKKAQTEAEVQIEACNAELQKLQHDLAAADPDLQKINEEIAGFREKIASCETSLVNLLDLMQQGDSRVSELNKEVKETEDQIGKVQENIAAAQKELESLENIKEGGDKESLQEEIEQIDEQTLVFLRRKEELLEQRRIEERELDSIGIKAESVEIKFAESARATEQQKEKLNALEGELSQMNIRLDSAQVKFSTKQRKSDEIAGDRKKQGEKLLELEQTQASLSEKLQDTKSKLAQTEARIGAIEELLAEDSSEAINELIDQEVSFFHLAEEVKFKDSLEELPPKVSAALSSWLDRVLLKSWEDLLKVDKWISSKGKGSINASLTSNSSYDGSHLDSSFICLSDYIECDHSDIKTLLSRLFYFDSSQSTIPTDAMEQGLILFADNGMVLEGQQTCTIGLGNKTNKLAKKAELEKLQESRTLFSEKATKLEEQFAKLTLELSQLREISLEKEKEHQNANQELLVSISELERAKDAFNKVKTAIVEINEHLAAESGTDQLNNSLADLHTKRDNVEKKLSIIASDIEDISIEEDDLKEKRMVIQNQLERAKIESATLHTKRDAAEKAIKTQTDLLEQLQGRLHKQQESVQSLNNEVKGSDTKKQELEVEIAEYIVRRDELTEKQNAKREANSGIVDAIRAKEKEKKTFQDTINRSQKELHTIELKVEKIRMEVQTAYQETVDRYNKDLDKTPFEKREDFNKDQTTKKVARLRNSLENMGPVNMMAVEEYDKIDERESFIVRQKDEVVSCIALLEMAIEEIEESSEAKFRETFKVLNQEFSELFPILFPGGDAQIIMTNEEKPLEAGVEILVRLPGKKRQNMRLFSGGEKALTAIALIFALLKSKPTPFCFLDEVDAPLDETNVGRYNRVLEALSDRFQFIVITHNRRTMEVLDTLYGVTMQEPGVSKVVGVDMTQDLPDHLKKSFKETSNRQGAVATP